MSATSRRRLFAKLKNKAYRDAYTVEHVKTITPLQIRTLREAQGWTQGKLAEVAKTTQTAISRTEDPNYGNLTLNNLLKIAAALDVGLLVKFVPFSRLVKEFEDLSPQAMSAPPFVEELSVFEAWADDTHEMTTTDPGFQEGVAASAQTPATTSVGNDVVFSGSLQKATKITGINTIDVGHLAFMIGSGSGKILSLDRILSQPSKSMHRTSKGEIKDGGRTAA